ncbi:substrate-binding domain-containing protein [Nocardioides sp.]|uniref:substrate-binding domain-containing protein n=1 Tax=Nocardioides sp. TaxID=35761 RepID=UPI0039E4292C
MKSQHRRRGLAALLSSVLVAGLLALAAPPARADTTELDIVGTSDVSDSKLFDYLKPLFEAAYPQYDVSYTGSATLNAITLSKTGNYDALMVHAASVENQYVADGWSAESYGRAVFWGDFVLLGPASDPAGVLTSSTHDIATAFEQIAAAGEAGKAHFYSRGGTSFGSGTTVQEHAIWALTDDTLVTKCTVSSTYGGGEAPASATGDCPDTITFPDWYNSGDRKQAPNIQAANECTDSYVSGTPDCYTFTDRGTFQYLYSTGALDTLQIVTRDNADTARGGIPALVNSFHAYAINPDMFSSDVKAGINLAGATAWLDWLTSSAGQAAVNNYLNDTGDAPFLPSASPEVTASAHVKLGKKRVVVTGTVSNVVPGTPALDGVTVRLFATRKVGVTPTQVATATTDANGDYKIAYQAKALQFYTVTTDQLTKVEVPTLTPVFADILQPGSAAVALSGSVRLKASWADTGHRKITLSGKVGPVATAGAKLQVWGKKGNEEPKLLGTRKLAKGRSSFSFQIKARSGRWKYQVVYTNRSYLVATSSKLTKKFKH